MPSDIVRVPRGLLTASLSKGREVGHSAIVDRFASTSPSDGQILSGYARHPLAEVDQTLTRT